jgi:hypothetical protein
VPHLTLTLSANGPLIEVWIGISQARRNALTAAGQAIPAPVRTQALVDTGASCTCVDATVLQQLGVPSTGTTPVHTPSTGQTPINVNQYDVSVIILFDTPSRVLYSAHTMAVVEGDLSLLGVGALIGRDILATAQLVYNGVIDIFTLSF